MYFNPKWKKVQFFFFLFTTSNAEPDVDPIVFVIEPAVRNSIVWFVGHSYISYCDGVPRSLRTRHI